MNINEMAVVDCPECGMEFKTSPLKRIGEKFKCTHCYHPMVAESDWGQDGEIIWFAKTDNKEIREQEH